MNRIEQWCSWGLHGTVCNATTDDKDKWEKKERGKKKGTDEMMKTSKLMRSR